MHRNMHALSLVPSDPFSTLSDVSSALVFVFCGALWRFIKARIKKQESKSKNRKAKTQSNKEHTRHSLVSKENPWVQTCHAFRTEPTPSAR